MPSQLRVHLRTKAPGWSNSRKKGLVRSRFHCLNPSWQGRRGGEAQCIAGRACSLSEGTGSRGEDRPRNPVWCSKAHPSSTSAGQGPPPKGTTTFQIGSTVWWGGFRLQQAQEHLEPGESDTQSPQPFPPVWCPTEQVNSQGKAPWGCAGAPQAL